MRDERKQWVVKDICRKIQKAFKRAHPTTFYVMLDVGKKSQVDSDKLKQTEENMTVRHVRCAGDITKMQDKLNLIRSVKVRK